MEKRHRDILVSTAYLPPIGWVKEVADARNVRVEAMETYPKQTFRNRCQILTANGVLSLSIPVSKPLGRKSKTRDIRIFYGENWQRMHRRAIDTAYRNAPFYEFYMDGLLPFYRKKFDFLLDFNLELTHSLLQMMDIPANLSITKAYVDEGREATDLRQAFSPKNTKGETPCNKYIQVFSEKFGFVPGLSIIDLLFNEGPAAKACLSNPQEADQTEK
jgi:hypothetical protein